MSGLSLSIAFPSLPAPNGCATTTTGSGSLRGYASGTGTSAVPAPTGAGPSFDFSQASNSQNVPFI